MIVVDCELSGLDPEKDSILSIGAVDMNNVSRIFNEECKIWDGAHVSEEALAVNGYTHAQITDPVKMSEAELIKKFFAWLAEVVDHTIAGQNVWVDCAFLRSASKRGHIDFPLARRVVDIHSLCFGHMIKRGLVPPLEHGRSNLSSDTISKYCGIPREPKPHLALNGAKYEAEQLSRLLYDRPFFTEFKKYPIPWVSI